MSEDLANPELRAAPLAYENRTFLNSPDGRILRILSEYAEPLARFRREKIQDTVVFFGSARFQSRSDAERALQLLEEPGAHTPGPPPEVTTKRWRLEAMPIDHWVSM